MNAIQTPHNLNFESCESEYSLAYSLVFGGAQHRLFRVGTCEGQWGYTGDSYYILSVINKFPGNGHFEDVLAWFEYSCKRDNKNLLVLECMNKNFYQHLVTKRGFIKLDELQENCIKVFNHKLYNKLLSKGNEIIKRGTLTCV